MTGFSGRRSYKHAPCSHCGTCGPAHEKERIYPDDGPAGTYHHAYYCPDESGRRYSP